MSCHILLICLLGIVTITEGQPSSLLATLMEVEGMDRGGWLYLTSSMWLPPSPCFSRSALAPLAFFLLAIFLHPSQPESFFCCSFCVDHHHILCLKSVPTLASSSPSLVFSPHHCIPRDSHIQTSQLFTPQTLQEGPGSHILSVLACHWHIPGICHLTGTRWY